MITLRKLKTLPPGTRVRKTLRLLEGFEMELRRGVPPEDAYLLGLLEILREDLASGDAIDLASRARKGETEALREEAAGVVAAAEDLSGKLEEAAGEDEQLRLLNGLRHALLALLAMEPGEWDLLTRDAPESEASGAVSSGSEAPRFSCFDIALYLEDVRSPFNLGSIVRSAEAFGAAGLILSPGVPRTTHPRARRAAMGSFEKLPTGRCDALPVSREGAALPVFALEVGGTPIQEFVFPRRGVCLLGSEELGLSPGALAVADASWGRCSIPLYGAKGSINVGVAAGILLGRWTEALAPVYGDPGQKKDSAELRRSLFDALFRDFCHGLR